MADEYDAREAFLRWWEIWPLKIKKAHAERMWLKHITTGARAAAYQRNTPCWTMFWIEHDEQRRLVFPSRYVPHPGTFITRGYGDDPPPGYGPETLPTPAVLGPELSLRYRVALERMATSDLLEWSTWAKQELDRFAGDSQ
jgi:hypothetical protein